MKLQHHLATVLLVAALALVGYGIVHTSTDTPTTRASRRTGIDRSVNVDQSSLITAERLVRMPTSEEERQYAEDAMRYADQEMDVAFAQAVRQTANQTRALSPEAKEIDAKLQQAQRALATDQAQVAALTAESAKASPTTALSVSDRLNLAKAQAALDQDEVDDARADLRRAGGDPQGRMQEMIARHDAASRSSDSVHVVITKSLNDAPGLIHRLQALQSLYDKESEVKDAKAEADSLADAFKRRHDRLEARAAARLRDTSVSKLSHDSAAALLASTQQRALDEKTRSTLDERVDNQHRLSDVYAGWLTVLAAQERVVINRALRGLAAIILVVLVGILLTRWIEHVLGTRKLDRRRTQTLYMVSRVSVQVLCALFILLVIFGPPNNLGTFLGLAGAGLTVALKDFIVGFLGWFVLMGKNGIRIGDLVEINGVTGEVVELGMFYTELLETGGWSDADHPTGRRVTFNNGFAIEGHYFNFSTSGRWLWDEVRIVVPNSQNPQPLAEAIRTEIQESTAEHARQAEAQWGASRKSSRFAPISADATISLRPTPGGVEIVARYVTHVGEREQLRAKLYHLAVEMLGSTAVTSGSDAN
ncbi:MAG TPA: mechanosensitive ion channel domain-containing protein [Gemmatimonadaceae bacterium]